MVLERFLHKKWKENVATYSLFLGVMYTIFAYITSFLLFKPFIGLSIILFTVILALPAVIELFKDQYEKESEENLSFIQKHRAIIDFYIYFFIGCFVVFFLIAMIAPSHVFSLEDLTGKSVTGKATEASRNLPPPPGQSRSQVWGVFSNNVYVMLVAFLLSLFYGSGSLFLITFNGSIFAAALVQAIRLKIPHLGSFLFTYAFIGCNLGIIFLHLLPEVGAYFLAAVAGGVLSNAILKEFGLEGFRKAMLKICAPICGGIVGSFILGVVFGFFQATSMGIISVLGTLFIAFIIISAIYGSHHYRETLRSAVLLVIASIIVLYLAAMVEMNISKSLFTSNICVEPTNYLNMFWIVVIFAIVIFEFIRRKRKPTANPHHVKQYVDQCKKLGFSKSEIEKKLLNVGASPSQIKKYL